MSSGVLPPVAILAGGLATRMRPRTETVPKSMLEVAGEPFVAHQLRLLAREGVGRAVLCLGYLGRQVEDFVGNGARFGLEVAYSYDGDKLLGTGGALKRALPSLGERFFILYGDSYLDIAWAPVAEAFERSGRAALMTVFRNEGRWDGSNVVFADGRILVYSKTEKRADMAHIDWGLGLMRADALAEWPGDRAFDLAAVYGALVARGELAGYEVSTRFFEIGSPEGLAETDRHLCRQRRAAGP
jgi:NDP-sugar pyrophosphorylase family protein